ncbi:MAG: hypothetical protein MHM6MM_000978 [Cercozoa sp. M6MM]
MNSSFSPSVDFATMVEIKVAALNILEHRLHIPTAFELVDVALSDVEWNSMPKITQKQAEEKLMEYALQQRFKELHWTRPANAAAALLRHLSHDFGADCETGAIKRRIYMLEMAAQCEPGHCDEVKPDGRVVQQEPPVAAEYAQKQQVECTQCLPNSDSDSESTPAVGRIDASDVSLCVYAIASPVRAHLQHAGDHVPQHPPNAQYEAHAESA